MDDRMFGPGVLVGFLFGFLSCMLVWGAVGIESSERWKQECVLHGAAEYVTTNEGLSVWQWKEVANNKH